MKSISNSTASPAQAASTRLPGAMIVLDCNILAPSKAVLFDWLHAYGDWARDGADPKTEPKCKLAKEPAATTVRFIAKLSYNGKDMWATLLNVRNSINFGTHKRLETYGGSWSFSEARPAPIRSAAPAPEFWVWLEDRHFESRETLVSALEQAAQDVLSAKIDCTGGYGGFSAFDKLPDSGAYRFRCHIQMGNRQRCADFIRQVAIAIAAGETAGNQNYDSWGLAVSDTFAASGTESQSATGAAPQPEAAAPAKIVSTAPRSSAKGKI